MWWGAGTLWAFTGIMFQLLAGAGFSHFGAVALRLGIACLGMLVLCLAKRIDILRIAPKDLLYCAGAGIFGCALFNFAYFNAVALTSLAATLAGSILLTGAASQAAGFGFALYNFLSTYPLSPNPPEVVTLYTMLFGTLATFVLEPPTRYLPLLAIVVLNYQHASNR